MRTTLTIDDTVLRDLKEIAHRTETPLKDVIDKVLRAGIDALERSRKPRAYRAPTFRMGQPSELDLTKALDIAARLEDDETLRKLALRK